MKALTRPFEGPEKKLEIILHAPQPGLRSNADGRWERVVRESRAEIISTARTDRLDAYLLSESSLFVWEDRILMITCGKTTLARAVPEILSVVDRDRVAFVFYEQKNFMFPQEQPSRFENDVDEITAYFPGKYYKLGPANYDHVNVFYSSHSRIRPEQDATLQILMHDLPPDAMNPFCAGEGCTAHRVKSETGLDRLYDGGDRSEMIIDGHLFSPCGYSMNGIRHDTYFTVHVTPQTAGSYVSFETNIMESDYSETIGRVISIFRPGRFSVVLTTSMDEPCAPAHQTLAGGVSGYAVADKTQYEFDCGYGVTFLNYLPNGMRI